MTLTNKTKENIVYILKWIPLGVLTGVIGGLLGAAFHMSLDYVTSLREHNEFLLYFLPMGGIAIAFMYNISLSKGNIDIKRVFQSVRENKDIPIVMIPLIFAATLITHMFGGSAGREGAALQLGGSMGYNLAKKLKMDNPATKIMVTAGMSSVFSALFGVPFAATVFSLEVINRQTLNFRSLFAALISSVSAFVVAQFMHLEPVRFHMPEITQYNAYMVLKASLLALMCAGVCIAFATAIKTVKLAMKKYIPNPYLRAVIGGIVIVLLTIILKTTDYNGAGMDVIVRAISGHAKRSAFILKIIFTAITLAAGFKGGEIVPTFFIGATFGCFISTYLGINAGVGASLALVAMFAGMTKCPIASLLLAAEVFGARAISLFAIVIVITFVFSGRFGLYDNASEKSIISLGRAK